MIHIRDYHNGISDQRRDFQFCTEASFNTAFSRQVRGLLDPELEGNILMNGKDQYEDNLIPDITTNNNEVKHRSTASKRTKG